MAVATIDVSCPFWHSSHVAQLLLSRLPGGLLSERPWRTSKRQQQLRGVCCAESKSLPACTVLPL